MFEYQDTKVQIGKILKLDPEKIRDQDNLIELGINSLKIMRLVNDWRKRGAKVTFAELISQPTFQQWWNLLAAGARTVPAAAPVKMALPQGQNNVPFDLTDVQYAYWVGRKKGQVLGDTGCHAYIEIAGHDIDAAKLQLAWQQLIKAHPALRTRFTGDGQQEILAEAAAKIKVCDWQVSTKAAAQAGLAELRQRLSHRKLAVEQGENAGLTLSLLPDGAARLHFDVDLLAADVQSFQIILRDLAALYRNETLKVNSGWHFGAYLEAISPLAAAAQAEAARYWQEKVPDMPLGPVLPLKKAPETIAETVFVPHCAEFTALQWKTIRQNAARYQITPAMVLLTAYCEVLDRWSEQSRFLVNLPLFNRHTEFEGIEDVVADFSNILLLDVDCRDTKTFAARAQQLQQRFHQDMKHSAYSGVQVTRALAQRFPEAKSIAPVVFACNLGEPLLDEPFRQTFGELEYMVSQTPQVWIDFQTYDYNGGLYLRWDVVEELFPDGMAGQMFAACCDLISQLAEPGSDWQQVFAVRPVETLLAERNDQLTQPAAKNRETLLEGIFAYAKAFSDKTAVIQSDTGESLSYGELIRRCLQMAAYLQRQGVSPGDVVAISMERGIAQVVGALGILAAGACYTPIAPTQPASRRAVMYRKSGARYVLTTRSVKDAAASADLVTMLLLEDSEAVPGLEVPQTVSSSTSAYIIFTSGSTGEPKGVKISHGSAMNTIEAVNRICGVGDQDAVLAVSSLEFDLSVYDLFGVLNAGGTVVCVPDQQCRNADYWAEIVSRYQITLWNSVPVLFDMLLIAAAGQALLLPSLRWVLLSGDWIGLTLPERMSQQCPMASMLAMGGATEASIWSNYYVVTLPLPQDWQSIPYGYPLSNQKYRIIDGKKRDCPDWVPGELWIGGDGLAQEYAGDPDQTAASFVIAGQQRWYRTGDLGRYHPDGRIEFLGRRDHQIKIRGHRIELGEIEAVIQRYPGIREVVVLAREQPSGQKELWAFLTGTDGTVNTETIKQALTKLLPEYMIPKQIVNLDFLPLNSNGKIDRKQLLVMVRDQESEPEMSKRLPETELEQQLAGIWQMILKQPKVYREDSYFELGGDSLVATQLAAAVRKTLGTAFKLEDVFEYPVLADQAKLLAGMTARGGTNDSGLAESYPVLQSDQSARFEPFPLTEIQKAYWIGRKGVYALGEISTHYYFEIENTGFDPKRFEQAFQTFLASHDMMRAVILADGEHQVVLSEVPHYEMPLYHLENKSAKQVEDQIKQIRQELSHRVFEPEQWPLFDIRVSVLPEQKVRLHLCFDNIIFDGSSIFYFFKEISRIYEQQDYTVRLSAVTFRDYVLEVERMKRSPVFRQDKDYWLERLHRLAPAPELPTLETPVHTFDHLEYRLSAARWEQIKVWLSRAGAITPSVFLLTAYAEILGVWSRHQRFTINLTRFNRLPLHPEIDQVVGDFTSLTLLEIDLGKAILPGAEGIAAAEIERSFTEQCRRIQKQLVKDLEHSLFCGVQVQRELAKVQQSQNGILMPVVFTSSLGLQQPAAERNWFENRVYSSSETPQVWLDHQVTEEQGDLVLIWDYVKELFPEQLIPEMFAAYIGFIERLADDADSWDQPDVKLVQIPRIADFERQNTNLSAIPQATLVALFEQQCGKTPLNTAIISGSHQVTYQELQHRVNQTAAAIWQQQKQPSLIGIYMEKGVEQVIAALAIMKTGAAYLPLDVHHPDERVRQLLAQAGTKLLLTQSWIETGGITDVRWINVDTISGEVPPQEEFTPVSPEATAYVIYTSGSTGNPKGVTITHRSAVNTILDINQRFEVTEKDRCIALSNLNFDLSVYDLFGLLAAGGAIVFPEPAQQKNPAHWLTLLEQHQVSIWNTVPTFMSMLTEFNGSNPPGSSLRLVMLSGDWIPLTLPEQVKQLFPAARFVSLGGATEAAIWSNYYLVDQVRPQWSSIPYGRPLTNQMLYVYNDRLQPCPVGVAGELYIGGAGVAVGYWNDPARTAAQFIHHPVTGVRLYKTGDLGRYLPDGNIEFLGREDNQVKIRGFRIGLGEIEQAVSRYPDVKDSVVIVDSDSQQLVAFVTAEADTYQDTHPELNADTNMDIQAISLAMMSRENVQAVETLLTDLEVVSLQAAADLLRALGILTEDNNPFSIAERMVKSGTDQRFESLIRHWLERLIRVKALSRISTEPQMYQGSQSLARWSLAVRDVAESAARRDLRAYYQTTKPTYIEVLQGKRDVVSLFLDNEFTAAVNQLNFYQLLNQYYYDVLLKQLRQYTDRFYVGKPLAVLDLGSRFGSWLDQVAGNKIMERWDYLYCDESQFFLTAKAGQYKGLPVAVFDINQPARQQFSQGQQFDLILADNSLHRAADLDQAICNIKQLLRPDGVLLFLENTSMNCFDLNIAGLYEYGFSQFKDERQEPFLVQQEWYRLLTRNGMEMIEIFGHQRETAAVYHRYLYAARAKESVRVIDRTDLAAYLEQQLPEYMVPNRTVILARLPLTANGKIDRRGLEQYLDGKAAADQVMEAPQTEIEEVILTMWQELLRLDAISVTDQFFEIGGDSLLAIQCMNRLIKHYGVPLSLQEIFDAGTIRNLAGVMEAKTAIYGDELEGEI